MPEYLAPGVFIEEIERGPRPIEGVATSTAAFLGETERGPTRPRLVTSFNEYRRYFGSAFGEGKYMPYAVSGFFENGGRRAYVCRIVGTGRGAPPRSHVGGSQIEAIGPGEWGNRVFVKLVEQHDQVRARTRIRSASASRSPIGRRRPPGGPSPDPVRPHAAAAVCRGRR